MPLQIHPDGCTNCIWDEATASFAGPFTPCTYCPGIIDVAPGENPLIPKPAPEPPIDGVCGPEAYDWALFERQQRMYNREQAERDDIIARLMGSHGVA